MFQYYTVCIKRSAKCIEFAINTKTLFFHKSAKMIDDIADKIGKDLSVLNVYFIYPIASPDILK